LPLSSKLVVVNNTHKEDLPQRAQSTQRGKDLAITKTSASLKEKTHPKKTSVLSVPSVVKKYLLHYDGQIKKKIMSSKTFSHPPREKSNGPYTRGNHVAWVSWSSWLKWLEKAVQSTWPTWPTGQVGGKERHN
jgi:hypothetical protein